MRVPAESLSGSSVRDKVVTAAEAVRLVRDGDWVVVEGFVGQCFAEELTLALEQRFLLTGAPRDLGTEVGKRLAAIGKKVQMVINYDNFYLDPALADGYKALIRSLAERYYASATRYTTSSFMRLKLSEHLSDRGLAPHIYESRQEAMNWLGKQAPSR